jgi:hypothetical protein
LGVAVQVVPEQYGGAGDDVIFVISYLLPFLPIWDGFCVLMFITVTN